MKTKQCLLVLSEKENVCVVNAAYTQRWECIKENKKVRKIDRKDALDQETDQENDQEKKSFLLFFLVAFLVEGVFSCLFS